MSWCSQTVQPSMPRSRWLAPMDVTHPEFNSMAHQDPCYLPVAMDLSGGINERQRVGAQQIVAADV